ncbi:MAG: ATP-binding protein [Desulfatiglandaceae bacterium]
MSKNRIKKNDWFRIPPWILVGSAFILVPILIFWTHENLNREKKFVTELMVEKGAALIRSFEAGARTGMMGMMGMQGMMGGQGGGFRLQRLLTETAQLPDIVYLMVTDTKGVILAHNDPKKIGGFHGKGLDLQRISHSKTVKWRLVENPDGSRVFEVFRRFQPSRGRMPGYHWRMMFGGSPPRVSDRPGKEPPADIIFVGLNMKPVEASRKGDARHSVIMALILLLVGFAGIFFLFLAQAYRSARSSLTRIKAFSDNVVENMPIGLLFIDADGKIVSFNQTAETLLKLSSSDVLGRHSDEVLPSQLEGLASQPNETMQIIEKEIDCPLKGGMVIPLDIIISSLKADDGALLGNLVLFRDLTELQELKGEVERSRRLASLGQLAAGIAHEIRNPLSSIKGFATYFKERYREVPEDQETADIMIQEVERLNRVIGQLLEFARPVSIERKSIDVLELVRQSLKLVEGDTLQKGIRIEMEVIPSERKVDLDPDKMKQVLLNLYLNALEAMERNGTLTVDIRDEKSGYVDIIISDTGAGIKKEDLAHVFDPYFTTKPSGTGLGLAIVHKIIESHGGEIRVESREGKGTRVVISLPVQGET